VTVPSGTQLWANGKRIGRTWDAFRKKGPPGFPAEKELGEKKKGVQDQRFTVWRVPHREEKRNITW